MEIGQKDFRSFFNTILLRLIIIKNHAILHKLNVYNIYKILYNYLVGIDL